MAASSELLSHNTLTAAEACVGMHRDSAYLFSVMLPMCDGQRPIRRIDLLSRPPREFPCLVRIRWAAVALTGAVAGSWPCDGNLVPSNPLAVDSCLYCQGEVAGMDRAVEAEFSEFMYSRWLQLVRCRDSVVQVRPGALARTPWPAPVSACHAGRANR
jgi:hypothetical protein